MWAGCVGQLVSMWVSVEAEFQNGGNVREALCVTVGQYVRSVEAEFQNGGNVRKVF